MYRKPLPLISHQWPTVPMTICVLRMSFDDLVEQHALVFEHWDEDGLGPARGGAYELESGLVVGIRDLEYMRGPHDLSGPEVNVDATDLVAYGAAGTVRLILAGLCLPDNAIDWMQDESVLDAARGWIRSEEDRRARRAAKSGD